MKQFVFYLLLIGLLFGCGNAEDPLIEGSQSEVVDEKTVLPTHIAVFEVEGMMCQKGCGAIIRKGLYETGGVSEVEVVFSEDNPLSEIKVYFDINKTSTEKMITVIGSLAEMRYSAKLKKVTESTIVNVEEKDEQKSKHIINDITSAKTSTSIISLPNLTKLLNSLIR